MPGIRPIGVSEQEYEDDHAAYIPTPEEIAAATAEIRSTWDEFEHVRRCPSYTPIEGGRDHFETVPTWTVPEVRTGS